MIYEGSLGSDKVLSPEIRACRSKERSSILGRGGLDFAEHLHLDPFGSVLSSWLAPATASSAVQAGARPLAAWEVGRGARASARKGLGHGRLGSGCVTGDPHSRRVGQSALLHYNKALERSHLGRKEDRHGSETRLRDPISWATWWGSMVQSKARIERGGGRRAYSAFTAHPQPPEVIL